MTIETTKQVTSKVEVPVPSFWKKDCSREYTALLNSNTVINIYDGESLTIVQNGSPNNLGHVLTNAHKFFDLCTEQEFMEAYSKVLKSLSLQPELI